MPKRETAAEAYKRNHSEVDFLLQHIEATLCAGAVDSKDADWGDVGSMAHVREKLMEIAVGMALGPNESEESVQAMIEEEMTL